jgi:hypothetical protein
MITVPFLALYAAGGVASAFGAWLFHKVFKAKRQVAALEARVAELEK